MGLTVTVLGCSGTYATAGNACSGYLVQSDRTAVWVDAGPGTLANLQEHVALTDLDALVLSHSHPDHWLELPVLRNALKYRFGVEGLRVLGTARTLELAEVVCESGVAPTFAWEVVADGSAAVVGDIDLRFSRTDHPVETLAVRLAADGRTMAYSADTGPAWSLTSLDPEGAGFDLVLYEATLDPDEEGAVQHCSAAQAVAIAASSGVRHLVLTHLMEGTADARLREAGALYAGPLDTARPHARYEV